MTKNIKISIENQTIHGVLQDAKSDKLMILVHGFAGDMRGPDNIFIKLADSLAREGIASFRFGFRGTPPSEGQHVNSSIASETKDLQTVFKHIKSTKYKKIGLLGESMGGTIILNLLNSQNNLNPSTIVLWYPAIDLKDTDFQELLIEQNEKQIKDKGFIEMWGVQIGPSLFEEIKILQLYETVKNIKCPILFMHGDADVESPVVQSQKAFKLANEPKQLEILRGANHCFKNEQREAIAKTIKFLQKYF